MFLEKYISMYNVPRVNNVIYTIPKYKLFSFQKRKKN